VSKEAPYLLYYWPGIQGRGEFVRLAFEAAGTAYVDVARRSASSGMGLPAMMKLMQGGVRAPLAPPFVAAHGELVAQTAHILQWLAPELGLVPKDAKSRRWAHQLQLTVTDLLLEVHDTHHPLATHLYYEDQKAAARKRAAAFVAQRMPKFLGYFERVLAANPAGPAHAVGRSLSYVDLSLFQVIAGLRYAFPRALARLAPAIPHLLTLNERVGRVPNVARYLKSKRRIPFNENGIFRHYPELDH
jgi:glutathione S-transferase